MREARIFESFYWHERSSSIALANALGAGKLRDPEQTAQDGWHRFYPHWADCDHPAAYLRTCVTSAARDELRALGTPPVTLSLHAGDHTEGLVRLPADGVPGSPASRRPDGDSWNAWQSWDPPRWPRRSPRSATSCARS
jgi:hypothetical protein